VSAIRTLTCPACSAPLEPGVTVCPYCDTPLAIRAEAQPIDAAAVLAAWEHAELSDLRAAAARRPIDPAANYALGVAYCRMGLWEDALDPFRTAAEKMPENPDFQYAVAAALHELVLRGDTGRNRWVEDRLQRALAVAPDHAMSLMLAAHRAGRAGDADAMLAALARVVEVAPGDAANLLAGFVEDNPDHAEAALLARPSRRGTIEAAASAGKQAGWLGGCAGFSGLLLLVVVLLYSASSVPLEWTLVAMLLTPAVVWLALQLRSGLAERRAREARIASPEEEDLLAGRERDPQALLAFAGEVIRAVPPGVEYRVPRRPVFPQ